jgi:hypothetical protein
MSVNQILDQLRTEEQKLHEKRDELKRQEKANTTELENVKKALAALGEKPSSKASRKPPRPTVTQAEVIEAIEQLLEDKSPLEVAELKAAVQSKLTDTPTPKSMQGFALRFAEAINFLTDEKAIVDTPTGYRLEDDLSRVAS